MNVIQALEWAFASDWGTDWAKDCQAMVELAEEVKRIHAANIDLTERVLYAERERNEAKGTCEWTRPEGWEGMYDTGCGHLLNHEEAFKCCPYCGGKIEVKEAK